ncbi:MAG: PIN domain-containing protein [Pyrinomonadaceae bacterium]
MSNEVLRIYLDVCCLQRSFDDQRQARVHLEAEAVKLILAQVEAGELVWVGSEVIEYEIAQNSDPERALKAMLLAAYAGIRVSAGGDEDARAGELELMGFTGLDALHLACAESAGVAVFLTTDDKLLKRAARFADDIRVQVANPLEWVRRRS